MKREQNALKQETDYSMPAKVYRFEPSTIETIDTGLYEWLNETLDLKTDTNEGLKKVPVIWLGTERAFQIKNNKNLRDDAGRLKLPVITVNRESITKDPTFKGAFQAHLYENSDYQGGAVTIYRRINPEKTRNIANAEAGRVFNTGNENVRNDRNKTKKRKIVYEEISIPVPTYITVMYEIVIKTEYQQQINDLVPPFIARTGLINSFFFEKDQYRYEAFIEQDFSDNNNIKDLNEEERLFQTTIKIKVLGYLIGEGANRDEPKITVRENQVRVRISNERVIVGDQIPWLDQDNDYRE